MSGMRGGGAPEGDGEAVALPPEHTAWIRRRFVPVARQPLLVVSDDASCGCGGAGSHRHNCRFRRPPPVTGGTEHASSLRCEAKSVKCQIKRTHHAAVRPADARRLHPCQRG